MEVILVAAVLQMVLAVSNIVSCLWEHDTKTLLPWMFSFLGWFIVGAQMMRRIEGEK